MLFSISPSYTSHVKIFYGFLMPLACLSFASNLLGDLIVSPNPAANVEGNLDSNLPFSTAAYSFPSQRYQQVYGSAEFASVSGPQLITGIAFRPDGSTGNAFTEQLNSIQINLSTTLAQPDNLSAFFANNVGIDDTLVHSGPMVLSSAFTGPMGGPKDFDITINFTTPFLYDSSLGNLLLDVRAFSGSSIRPFDAILSASDNVSRVMTFINQNANSPSGNIVDTVGLATRFSLVAIPEPSTIVLTALGALIVAPLRRRKSKRDVGTHGY